MLTLLIDLALADQDPVALVAVNLGHVIKDLFHFLFSTGSALFLLDHYHQVSPCFQVVSKWS